MNHKLTLEELMDINECASLIRLKVGTIRQMCMRKQIPFYKIGRKVFFHKTEITKWVMSNKVA